jgi:hypothetical protein
MPFAAFPHQINDPIKLRRTLKVAKKLLESGNGIDDPSLGYSLFLNGIIRSRGYSGSLRQQLKEIQKKEPSAQSPLRIARDLRRFFLLFGFMKKSHGQFRVTERGAILIKESRSKLTKAEKRVWLEGLLNLRLPVNATTFRPVKMMLEAESIHIESFCTTAFAVAATHGGLAPRMSRHRESKPGSSTRNDWQD